MAILAHMNSIHLLLPSAVSQMHDIQLACNSTEFYLSGYQ